MRKLLLPLTGFMFFAVSCEKEEMQAVPAAHEQPAKVSAMEGYSGYRMLWAFDPFRWTCLNVPENCHPEDIIIRAPRKRKLDELFDVAGVGNDMAIRAFLTENKNELSVDIPFEWLNGGIDGTYEVRYHYSKDNDTRFLLFKTGEKVAMAFPFVKES